VGRRLASCAQESQYPDRQGTVLTTWRRNPLCGDGLERATRRRAGVLLSDTLRAPLSTVDGVADVLARLTFSAHPLCGDAGPDVMSRSVVRWTTGLGPFWRGPRCPSACLTAARSTAVCGCGLASRCVAQLLTLVADAEWQTERQVQRKSRVVKRLPPEERQRVPDGENHVHVTLPKKYRVRRDRMEGHYVKGRWVQGPVGGQLRDHHEVRDVDFTIKETTLVKAKGQPIKCIADRSGRIFWAYEKRIYVTSDALLTPEDVAALVNEDANRRRLRLEKAHALQSMTQQLESRGRRDPIPQDVKVAVWQRDGGRCVQCASNESLEFDHIIPLAMGGANTTRNLQLLCETCNRRKGATLG